MHKIPVGATIAHAYRFAFGDFFKILGVVWLSWAIMAAGGLLLLRQSTAFVAAAATGNLSGVSHILLFLFPFWLAMFVLLFMQVVGITQLALGLGTGSPYYYFSLGKPIWRLIGAMLLLVLFVAGCYLLIVLGGVLFAIAATALRKSMPGVGMVLGIVTVVAFVVAFCAYVYAIIRLAYFITPIVIAEGKIDFRRSWALGRGNFWRIFLILLAIGIPFAALELAFLYGYLMPGQPPMLPPHATPEQIAATHTAIAAWNTAMMARLTGSWYLTYPLFVVFSVLFYGASCGAQCFAYRAIAEPQEPITSPP